MEFPNWVRCNHCSSRLQLQLTNCGHIFCIKCRKAECFVCQHEIITRTDLEVKGQVGEDVQHYFQDSDQLMQVLQFQLGHLKLAAQHMQVPDTFDDASKVKLDQMHKEIVFLKEENRYWEGLFKATTDTPTKRKPRLVHESPAVGFLPTPPSPSPKQNGLRSPCSPYRSPRNPEHSKNQQQPIAQHIQFKLKEQQLRLQKKETLRLKDLCVKLEGEISQLKGECDTVKRREEILCQQLHETKSELSSLQDDVRNTDKERESLYITIKENKDQIKDLQANLNQVLEENFDLKKKQQNAETDLSRILEQEQEHLKKIYFNESELQRMTEVIKGFENTVDSQRDEIYEKEKEVSSIWERLHILQDQHASCPVKMQTLVHQNENLIENLLVKEKELSSLKSILESKMPPTSGTATRMLIKTPGRTIKHPVRLAVTPSRKKYSAILEDSNSSSDSDLLEIQTHDQPCEKNTTCPKTPLHQSIKPNVRHTPWRNIEDKFQ